MLGRNVQRHRERRSLSGDTGDVDNTLRVTGADFACLGGGRWVQPATEGQLGGPDWMGEINVETGIVAYSIGASRIVV
jgi:hypothetical protein